MAQTISACFYSLFAYIFFSVVKRFLLSFDLLCAYNLETQCFVIPNEITFFIDFAWRLAGTKCSTAHSEKYIKDRVRVRDFSKVGMMKTQLFRFG